MKVLVGLGVLSAAFCVFATLGCIVGAASYAIQGNFNEAGSHLLAACVSGMGLFALVAVFDALTAE